MGTFLGIQVTVWNSARTFFGVDQKLAQVVAFATLTATVALVVAFLTLDPELGSSRSGPVLPVLQPCGFQSTFHSSTVGGRVNSRDRAETFTRLADPIAQRWHVAALACCVAWTVAIL